MSNRESRGSAVWIAALAGGLGLLGPLLRAGGALTWTVPLAALPAALAAGSLWRRMGGMEGLWTPARVYYYIWALVLLAESARGSAHRLGLAAGGDGPWLYLVTGLLLCLWLCWGEGTVPARVGHLLFLTVATVLALVVALSVPAIRWENLSPGRETTPLGWIQAVLIVLSLTGYGVYGLCLPGRAEEGKGWWVGFALSLCALLLALIGSFGPALPAQREEPVLLLLEGVRVPGAFRHGEAALEGGLALADLGLIVTLTWGCGRLGRTLLPAAPPWLLLLPAGGAILAGGVLPQSWQSALEFLLLPGGLAAGFVLPALAVLCGRGRRAA